MKFMETNPVVNKETADKDVQSWLDAKKISARKRENNRGSIDALANAIIDGDLVLENDKTFTQKLKFETIGEKPVKSLNYALRLKVDEAYEKLKDVSGSDADGRIISYIAALTKMPKGVIKKLDSEDYGIAQSIAIFFL